MKANFGVLCWLLTLFSIDNPNIGNKTILPLDNRPAHCKPPACRVLDGSSSEDSLLITTLRRDIRFVSSQRVSWLGRATREVSWGALLRDLTLRTANWWMPLTVRAGQSAERLSDGRIGKLVDDNDSKFHLTF